MRADKISRTQLFIFSVILADTVVACALLTGCGGGSHHTAKAQPARAPIREVIGSDTYPTEQMEVITLPEEFVIPIRITDEINSKHAHAGEMYSGSVDPSVLVNDVVVIPRGTEAHLRLTRLKKGGHVQGNAKVSLE